MHSGFDTRAVHAGQAPDPATGAVVTPISLSTTFAQDGVGGHRGFEYSRSGNPTRAALEACVASLELARHGLAFASGLAAEDNVLRLVPAGRPRRARQRRLRGHVPADRQGVGPLRDGLDGRRPDRPRRAGRRLARRHGDGVAGDADQPAADVHRHRGRRRAGPSPRRPGRRRQHVRHAVPAAADRARRRHRRALGDEVPRRAQRRRRRVRRRRRRRARRPPALHAERRRCRAGAVRLLPRAARRQDARRADGPPLLERPGRRRPARAPPGRRAGALPAAARSPRPRRGGQADARLRGHGQLPAARRRRGRQAGRRGDRAVHAGRVARRRREPHRAPGRDDPRLGRRVAARGPGRPAPAVRRHRVVRRPRRRPRTGLDAA